MSPCDDFVLLMHLYLDDEIGREERDALLAHLESCPGCRSLFEDYRLLAGELRAIPQEVPAGLHRDIMEYVERQTARPWWRRRVTRRVAALAASAAVLALAVVGGGRLQWGGASPEGAALSTAAATEQAAVPKERILGQRAPESPPQSFGFALDKKQNGEMDDEPYTPAALPPEGQAFAGCWVAVGPGEAFPGQQLETELSAQVIGWEDGRPRGVLTDEAGLEAVALALETAGFELHTNLEGEQFAGQPEGGPWLILIELID